MKKTKKRKAGKRKARQPKRKAKRATKKAPKPQENKIDLSTLKFCPECASSNVFYSKMRDELVCRGCGGIFSRLTPDQMKKFREVSGVI